MALAIRTPLVPATGLRSWVPNLLTVARVPLGLVYRRVVHRPGAGLAVLAAAGLTDVLDGWLARRWRVESPAGAVMDGVTDKLFALQVAEALVRTRRLRPAVLPLLFARELGELALGLAVMAHPETRWSWARHERAGLAGKATTTLQAATHLAAQFGWRGTSLLAGATGVLGALSALTYWRRERARMHPPARPAAPPAPLPRVAQL